jgi:hypothetical protein
MNDHMPKVQLLDMIQTARADWEALLAGIPEAWMGEPGVAGEWSVKDVVAHIARGERENIGVVHAHAVVGSELWRLSEDERNAAVFEKSLSVRTHVRTNCGLILDRDENAAKNILWRGQRLRGVAGMPAAMNREPVGH